MQKFGEIEGYPEGSLFHSRSEIKKAGLHKYTVHGISEINGVGCECVVLNGGYIDDIDNGDEILYTGEGGRKKNENFQSFDQPFTKGNLHLSKNKFTQDPIRVIRGYKLKDSIYKPKNARYRYDGLYYLEDYWPHTEENGHRIWRYKLIKENSSLPPANKSENKTERTKVTTNKIKRDPNIPKILKEKYDFKCQVCGIRLEAQNDPYAIGAHIKALGKPHDGPDNEENMIILCPNDHYLFDAFAFSINDDFSLIGKKGKLNLKHHVRSEYIKYHRNLYNLANRV